MLKEPLQGLFETLPLRVPNCANLEIKTQTEVPQSDILKVPKEPLWGLTLDNPRP